MKQCTKCLQYKNQKDFYRDKKALDGLTHNCKECLKYYSRKWARENPEKNCKQSIKWAKNNRDKINKYTKKYRKIKRREINTWQRRYYLKKRYGLTLEIYESMLKKQNEKCLICKKKEQSIDKRYNKQRNLAIDHDRLTGKVRGLLCTKCNTAIGSLDHNTKLLKSAIKYLESFKWT